MSPAFEANWSVDLLTGKMSAARGNFIVEPNGDVKVKGALMYDKVDVITLSGATQVLLFNHDNDKITSMKASTFILKDNDTRACEVMLPPPDLFPGVNIDLIMPTTSTNNTGTRLFVGKLSEGNVVNLYDPSGTTSPYVFWHPMNNGTHQYFLIDSSSTGGYTFLRLVSAPAYGSNAGDGYASIPGGTRYMWYVKDYTERT